MLSGSAHSVMSDDEVEALHEIASGLEIAGDVPLAMYQRTGARSDSGSPVYWAHAIRRRSNSSFGTATGVVAYLSGLASWVLAKSGLNALVTMRSKLVVRLWRRPRLIARNARTAA